jgi:hypothetical protein
MISVRGKMREVTPQGFFEAPFLIKQNGAYYEIYAAGQNPATIDYATSSSPLGPWTRKGRILDAFSAGAGRRRAHQPRRRRAARGPVVHRLPPQRWSERRRHLSPRSRDRQAELQSRRFDPEGDAQRGPQLLTRCATALAADAFTRRGDAPSSARRAW